MTEKERRFMEVFAVVNIIGLLIPFIGKILGMLNFILVVMWVGSVTVYKTCPEVFDNKDKVKPFGLFLPDLKIFMCGRESIKELVPVWVTLFLLGVLQYIPIIYSAIAMASGGSSQ